MEAVSSGWVTSGPKGEEFEQKFAEYVGAKHCVLVSSCTAALFLSYKWLQKKYNVKKMLCPSLTFAATVNEIVNAGIEPVFGDIDADSLCMKKPLNTKYDSVVTVHLTGEKASTEYIVPIVEDSAHRIIRNQCKDNNNLVCFSFYATKNLAMGEGGAICTNDDEVYEWLKIARHHGISKSGWNRYAPGSSWQYDIDFVGWKMNQSDILAAIGLVQLDKMDEINKLRADIVSKYNNAFGSDRGGLHLYPIFVDNRNEFIEFMESRGIKCSVHFLPIHKSKAFAEYNNISLPVTEYYGSRIVSLPLYPSMTIAEVEYVISNAKEFICK
jgi:dTDP-4-amino-4,6-dideoxygalactose transaminase